MKAITKMWIGASAMMLAIVTPNTVTYAQEESGKTVTETRQVGEFSGVNVSGNYTVVITQGEPCSVRIETEEGFLENVKTEVTGGNLVLGTAKNTKNTAKTTIYVTAKEINRLEASGVSKISSDNELKSASMEIEVSGASMFDLSLNTEKLSTEISGAGIVDVKGVATESEVEISGAGVFNGENLLTQKTEVEISGAGKAKVNTKQELIGDISGVGALEYSEEPAVKNIEYSGMGKSTGKNDTTHLQFGDKKYTLIEEEDNEHNKSKKEKKYDGHWGGLELGINGLLNQDYKNNLPAEYKFLDLEQNKSFAFNLNLFEKNFNLYHNRLGITTGLGLGFNNYRFKNDFVLTGDSATIDTLMSGIHKYQKNKLTASYLSVPLLLEYQIPAGKRKFHVSTGMIFGLRLRSHTKQVYEENGNTFKPKNYGDYHLSPFKYEATFRIGYGAMNLFANYSLAPLFDSGAGPELYPLTVGISLLSW